MYTALLLIDIQNDYFPGGKNELYMSQQTAQQAAKILAFFRKHHLTVIHVQHINTRSDAAFFQPNTQGIEIHRLVYPHANEHLIVKHTPDSFLNTDLQAKLLSLKIDNLIICGMMTHMCVDTTVRSAKAHGYNIKLIADACATKELIWQNKVITAEVVQATYLASLHNTFAQILTAEKWLAAL